MGPTRSFVYSALSRSARRRRSPLLRIAGRIASPRTPVKPGRDLDVVRRKQSGDQDSNPDTGSPLQAREVVREVVDVLVGQRAGDRGHGPGVVGPRPGSVIPELPDDVFRMLPRDTRDLVLPGELSQVAHRAQHLGRLLLSGGDAVGIGLEGDAFLALRHTGT